MPHLPVAVKESSACSPRRVVRRNAEHGRCVLFSAPARFSYRDLPAGSCLGRGSSPSGGDVRTVRIVIAVLIVDLAVLAGAAIYFLRRRDRSRR